MPPVILEAWLLLCWAVGGVPGTNSGSSGSLLGPSGFPVVVGSVWLVLVWPLCVLLCGSPWLCSIYWGPNFCNGGCPEAHLVCIVVFALAVLGKVVLSLGSLFVLGGGRARFHCYF